MAADLIENQPEAMEQAMRDQPIGRVGRVGRADEITAAALWLASPPPASSSASPYPVDGGFVAPSTVHRPPHAIAATMKSPRGPQR
jgi:NAD(P)-dependent dehydrogenase (short-subunit alcohol dehydrogenase family)